VRQDRIVVTGTIIIPRNIAGFRDANAYVRLEDISHADRAAEIVGQTVIAGLRHDARTEITTVPFRLEAGRAVDLSVDYVMRVWIDIDGDGRPGPGDLHSDQSHRVLTKGFGRSVEIEVRP
jgi:Type III secretion system lipoprotein chaperone (YscW)